MYVLLDIEWITNKKHHISPTQIAAMRVDDRWYRSALFYSRIKPKDETFHQKEERSLTRFRQAQTERIARKNDTIATDTEKSDFYTLTRSGYGFLAGAGYSSYHLRQCARLKGLQNIEGFSTCRDAERRGLTPCRLCRPTEKDNKLLRRARNTSLILPAVINKIAELKGIPPREVEQATAENAIRIFGLPVSCGEWS